MLSLRIRIWAQLQRLSLDYYEREMAGRIMTRMTTDVDQFESLIENGLLSALVSAGHVRRGRRRAGGDQPRARRCARSRSPSRSRSPRSCSGAGRPGSTTSRASGSRSSTPISRRACPVSARRRRSRTSRPPSRTSTSSDGTICKSRVAAQRLVAVYFPFVQFLSAVADAIVLGVGAQLIASGHLTTGALIAFILYIDMFFSPIQQLSQVFDSWQQTRVSVQRISRADGTADLTPAAADPIVPARLTGEITMSGVRFSYPVAHARGPAGARGPGRHAVGQCRRVAADQAARGAARDRPAARGRGDRRARRRDRRRQVDDDEAARPLL